MPFEAGVLDAEQQPPRPVLLRGEVAPFSFARLVEEYAGATLLLSRDDVPGSVVNKTVPLGEFVRAIERAGHRCADVSGLACFELREHGGALFAREHPRLIDELGLRALVPAGFRAALARWANGYQFVLWAAGAGAATSLHADVIPGTVLAQLAGRKRVLCYAPEARALLYMAYDPANREDVSAVDPRAPDLARFPLFASAEPLVFELAPGDALALPCGWFHHVEYLSASLSVSTQLYADWQSDAVARCDAFDPDSCARWWDRREADDACTPRAGANSAVVARGGARGAGRALLLIALLGLVLLHRCGPRWTRASCHRPRKRAI